MSNQLVIAAIGPDRPGLVDGISSWVLDSGGNIADSRMMVMGGEFAVLLLVNGTTENLAKLEASLEPAQKKLAMTIHIKHTGPRSDRDSLVPYRVKVVALDHPGIVHNLARFFSQRNINIQDLSTSTYSAAHSGTPMFAVQMKLELPKDAPIPTLCSQFLAHCEQLNLDAEIEPVVTQQGPAAISAVAINQSVPPFTVPSTAGRDFSLAACRGRGVVIYFYPRNNTAGPTRQGQDFRDQHRHFQRCNTVVVGVSRDSLRSHCRFKEKLGLPFDLLSDADETLCNLFGVIKLKTIYGRKFRGIERSTFLIDARGKLRRPWRGVRVDGHVAEILGAARDISGHA